jgi:anthranilate synthase/aminodeoxychorismate synthase-like glutamine amidotransferase
MILVIDNYDSFVHNLARYFRELGRETVVVRNDAVTADEVAAGGYEAVVLSPGPCTPAEAGVCLPLLASLPADLPLLGVCLGHQAIATAFGGTVGRVAPVHGRASQVRHRGEGLFAGLPSPLAAGRYHSLAAIEPLPDVLRVDATSDDGTVMALSHRTRPVYGLQFHPESVLTEHGHALLANFLRLAAAARGTTVMTPAASVVEAERPKP